MPKRPRRKPVPGSDLVNFRPCLSPGDPLRWLADEFAAAPFDPHVCDLGNGPEIIVPADEPGLIEELRAAAHRLDGNGQN